MAAISILLLLEETVESKLLSLNFELSAYFSYM